MPLIASEKMRRRKQNLKDEGKYKEYKKNHREIAKKCRVKKKSEIEHMKKARGKV